MSTHYVCALYTCSMKMDTACSEASKMDKFWASFSAIYETDYN
jgi:hypothetical protein